VFELNEILTGGPETYLLVLGLITLDAVFPTAPSETLLVAGGVLVAGGDLSAPLLVLAAATGALLGHSLLFALGRWAGPAIRRRLFAGPTAERRLERAADLLARRTWLLIVADFVPWGRTALMFSAGALELGPRRFYAFVIPGALLWASFYVALGVAGGAAFEDDWQALAASIAAALAIAGAAELVHRLRRGR
jgi:membrane-associated protein